MKQEAPTSISRGSSPAKTVIAITPNKIKIAPAIIISKETYPAFLKNCFINPPYFKKKRHLSAVFLVN